MPIFYPALSQIVPETPLSLTHLGSNAKCNPGSDVKCMLPPDL